MKPVDRKLNIGRSITESMIERLEKAFVVGDALTIRNALWWSPVGPRSVARNALPLTVATGVSGAVGSAKFTDSNYPIHLPYEP